MAKTDADFEDDIVRGLGQISQDSEVLMSLASAIHLTQQKWWHDANGNPLEYRNFGELMALCHSELSEALEGNRKNLRDSHLPEYAAQDVELVDCVIRIMDILGSRGIDVGTILWEKMIYNANRADHKLENRAKDNGKAY